MKPFLKTTIVILAYWAKKKLKENIKLTNQATIVHKQTHKCKTANKIHIYKADQSCNTPTNTNFKLANHVTLNKYIINDNTVRNARQSCKTDGQPIFQVKSRLAKKSTCERRQTCCDTPSHTVPEQC